MTTQSNDERIKLMQKKIREKEVKVREEYENAKVPSNFALNPTVVLPAITLLLDGYLYSNGGFSSEIIGQQIAIMGSCLNGASMALYISEISLKHQSKEKYT